MPGPGAANRTCNRCGKVLGSVRPGKITKPGPIAEMSAISGESRRVGVLSGGVRVVAGGCVVLLCCGARTITGHVPGEAASRGDVTY